MAIRRHFVVLDSWRGICAILVAVHHFFLFSINEYHSRFIESFFLFVDFFFVLSGFVIALNYRDRLNNIEDFCSFCIRRFGRVWPAHAFIMFAFLIFIWILFLTGENAPYTVGASPTTYDYRKFPLILALTNSLGLYSGGWNLPSWSISAEIFSYISFSIAFFFSIRLFIILILTILGFIMVLVLGNDYINMTANFGVFRCLFGFGMGVLTLYVLEFVYSCPKVCRIMTIPGIEILSIALTALYLRSAVIDVADASWISIFAPFVFSFLVLVFTFESGIVSNILLRKPFTLIGKISYSIYINHWFIFVFMAYIFDGNLTSYTEVSLWGGSYLFWDIPKGASFWLLLSLFLMSVLGVSWLTFWSIEDPGRRTSKSISDYVAASLFSSSKNGR